MSETNTAELQWLRQKRDKRDAHKKQHEGDDQILQIAENRPPRPRPQLSDLVGSRVDGSYVRVGHGLRLVQSRVALLDLIVDRTYSSCQHAPLRPK